MERSKEKAERRHSAPLPAPTAATNQGARLTANAIISNVLQKLAPRQEENAMDTSGSGTAEPKHDSTGTAGSVRASGSGTAGTPQDRAGTAGSASAMDGGSSATPDQAATASKQAPYRNFHQDNEPVAGSGNGTIFTTARYKNIKTQRQLRGEHTPIGTGPTADCFECGSIFVDLRGAAEGDWDCLHLPALEGSQRGVLFSSDLLLTSWRRGGSDMQRDW
jgi:hypothetical protein